MAESFQRGDGETSARYLYREGKMKLDYPVLLEVLQRIATGEVMFPATLASDTLQRLNLHPNQNT